MHPAFFYFLRTAQTLILLGGLACLVYGGYRLYDELSFAAASTRTTGEVVAFGERKGTADLYPGDTAVRGHQHVQITIRYPIVRFRSPVDGRLHRARSSIGYGGKPFEIGQTIPIRASSVEAAEARHSDLLWRFLAPAGLFLLGLFATIVPAAFWHTLDRDVPDPDASMRLFRSIPPVAALLTLGVVVALVVAVRLIFPHLSLRAQGVLTADPGLLIEAMRAAPPPPGQLLGETERWVAKVPILGPRAVEGAVLSAIRDGRRADLKRYLTAGRDPAQSFPVPPRAPFYLRAAASAGNADAIDLLIRAGFDPKGDRWTFEEAVNGGHAEVLRALAAAGAEPADSEALVESALIGLRDEVLLALIECGWADPAMTFAGRAWGGPEQARLLDVALSQGLVRSARELEKRGTKPASPLLSRLVAGDLAGMRAVLPEGDWARTRIYGTPLLSYAAQTGNLPIVRRLVGLGADPAEVAALDPDSPKRSALDEAVRRGHVDVARFLAGLPAAKPWLEPEDRPAPVGIAAGLGRWETVRALVEAGANPSPRYRDAALRDGYLDATPLHRAAFEGNLEMVNWLLAHGADPRAEAEPRVLPVEVAKGDEVVRALVEAGGGGP